MAQKIICIDFDNTLVEELPSFDPNNVGEILPGAKEGVDRLRELGYKIIIFTVRENKEVVKKALVANGIQFDVINERIATFSNSPKPYADYYIDDRGLRFQGDWNSIVEFIQQNDAFQNNPDNNDEPLFISKWIKSYRTQDRYDYVNPIPGLCILPYRITSEIEFLLRDEFCPVIPNLITIITGRIDEGETPEQAAIRELKEEAGYEVLESQLKSIGEVILGKQSNCSEKLFSVDLTDVPEGEITTDGTIHEKNSRNYWVPFEILKKKIKETNDGYLLSAFSKFLVNENFDLTKRLITASKRKYCCVMITDLPDDFKSEIKSIQKKIPEELLVPQGTGTEEGNSTADGIETLHHITVLYGLQSDDKELIQKLFDTTKKKFKLKNKTEITYFDKEEYTVAKVEIVVPEALKNFRSKLFTDISNQDQYSSWKPHCTIAYLKPGTRIPFELKEVEWPISELVFSDQDENLSKIAQPKKEFTPTEALDEFLKMEFIQNLMGPLLNGRDIFDFVKFGKEDHLAYYDKEQKSIVFDYDSFHSLVEDDQPKLFKVLAHEFTHLVQDLLGKLIIPENDIVENYFENESEVEAVDNEIRFFKSIGFDSEKIKKIFDGSFSRFGENYTEELKCKLNERIENIE